MAEHQQRREDDLGRGDTRCKVDEAASPPAASPQPPKLLTSARPTHSCAGESLGPANLWLVRIVARGSVFADEFLRGPTRCAWWSGDAWCVERAC